MTTPDHGPLLQLQGIGRVFQTESVKTHALSEIDLSVSAGEFIAITGASGCGKSTLLGIIGLLDKASTGRYRLAGQEVSDLPAARRSQIRNRHIGFIFQAFNLIDELSAQENVALPLEFAGVGRRERLQRAARLLAEVGMERRIGHRPPQLSGGQQQRVAIARALANQPQLILADEPTGNLDSESGDAVMALLARLHREGRTILMVTHSEKCAALASRHITMQDGRILSQGH